MKKTSKIISAVIAIGMFTAAVPSVMAASNDAYTLPEDFKKPHIYLAEEFDNQSDIANWSCTMEKSTDSAELSYDGDGKMVLTSNISDNDTQAILNYVGSDFKEIDGYNSFIIETKVESMYQYGTLAFNYESDWNKKIIVGHRAGKYVTDREYVMIVDRNSDPVKRTVYMNGAAVDSNIVGHIGQNGIISKLYNRISVKKDTPVKIDYIRAYKILQNEFNIKTSEVTDTSAKLEMTEPINISKSIFKVDGVPVTRLIQTGICEYKMEFDKPADKEMHTISADIETLREGTTYNIPNVYTYEGVKLPSQYTSTTVNKGGYIGDASTEENKDEITVFETDITGSSDSEIERISWNITHNGEIKNCVPKETPIIKLEGGHALITVIVQGFADDNAKADAVVE